jgi:predicted ATPase/class 3 adenylate cyclase
VGAPTAVTATFLFTDIEGSSELWEADPIRMRAALATHDAILRKAVEARGGDVFKHTGDGVCAVFPNTSDALAAAVDAQRALQLEQWDLAAALRVRMGIHVGEAEHRDGDYYGVALNRVGRLHAVAHAGQILVSGATTVVLHGNVPPDVELVDLGEVELRGMTDREHVFQVTHPDLPGSFPPLATPSTPRNLPAALTDLAGRDRELGQVLGLLGLGRVVTLTGFGGVGKTRLAIAAAEAASSELRDGTWWVGLAPASTDTVESTVAHAVGAGRPGVGPLDAVVARLAGRHALLVLDNCEHVAERAAEVVETLLQRCRELHVLATSRAPLGVRGERTLPLKPLGAPAPGAPLGAVLASPAVRLFEQRASDVDPSFELTAANAETVADICRRVDGLPLAIELAAARTRAMAPADLLAHLDQRFRLLRDRERGLADVVSWSYDLLTDDQRLLFDRLSVFRGRFTLAAATAVAGAGADELDVVETLDALVGQSLVDATVDGDGTRYGLLETLRDFGAARLDERGATPDAVERHRRFFAARAGEAAIGITGPDEAAWVRRLDEELADIRTAFERSCAEGDADACAGIVVALEPYAYWRLRVELADWARTALDAIGDQPARGDVLGVAVRMHWAKGDMASASALDASGGPTEAATSWALVDGRGTVELFRGAVQEAVDAFERACDLAREAGDDYRFAMSASRVALARLYAGMPDAADWAELTSELAARVGNPTATAVALWTEAVVRFGNDRAEAIVLLERSRALAEDVGNLISTGSATDVARQVRTGVERQSSVRRLVEAVAQLEEWGTFGAVGVQWGTVRRAVRALAELGRFEDAAVVAGAEAGATSKMPVQQGEADRHAKVLARLEELLGPEAWRRLTAEGAALGQGDLLARLRSAADAVGAAPEPAGDLQPTVRRGGPRQQM